MLIHWLGESCFLIQLSNGRRILLDPTNIDIDTINKLRPSIITISHNHNNCNNYINSNIIESCGCFNYKYAKITGILSYHDNMAGLKRGENIIFMIQADNIKVCHLGHIGHKPTKEMLSYIYNSDILFIPIGGHFTIDSISALEIINLINPKVIIPMFYTSSNSITRIDNPQYFLTNSKNVSVLNCSSLDTKEINNFSYPNTILLKKESNFTDSL